VSLTSIRFRFNIYRNLFKISYLRFGIIEAEDANLLILFIIRNLLLSVFNKRPIHNLLIFFIFKQFFLYQFKSNYEDRI